MDLSNLDSKFTECLGPSTLAAALVDNSCVRQLWLQNRFRPNIKDSKSYQVACKYSKGAIIGSAFIKALNGSENLKTSIANFLSSIR